MQEQKQERISKKIASNSIYSRRQAESLVKQAKVSVNNIIVTNPTTLVRDTDVIKINSIGITAINSKPKVWLFNKPRGCLTTKSDPLNRPTIYKLLPHNMANNLYVGRLDFNSEGLLLLTNNGDIVQYLTSAKNQIKRIYKVKTFGSINQEKLDLLKKGIKLPNGIVYENIEATIIKQNNMQTWIQFVLLEGKNNEIRNICKFFNLQVSRLVRTSFGPFYLNKLAKGAVKEANDNYISKYFQFLFQ